MPDFQQYIGVRYSGRKDPGDRIREIRVYVSHEDHEPYREGNPSHENGLWSRRELAEWLLERITEGPPVVIGLDHAFSFPQTYMDRNNLKTWESFLKDFEGHWPTHQISVRELLPGNPRTGDPDEHRLTGRWTASPKSPFQFDLQIQDSPAKATHAGLPWLDYLRRAGDRVHFWPFQGFEVPRGRSVIAEVRPARLRHRYPQEGISRESQDAYAICAWLQERDRLDLLRPYFTPPLSESEKERGRLEGWILGVA
ncbi:MAG TPA: hypothetical protein VHU81_01070 [Thermoanaerobaculia bacterium]|jgi:hypothetical protein|nr:hypothetical protein [Thermoanaerobaculia bacterium]